MKMALLCGVLGAVSCTATSPSRIPAAHEQVIRSEWAEAQRLLDSVDVTKTGLALPELCTWIPHDGPFETSASLSGMANGLFNPNTFVIRWNTQTPTVIRHEAGHAILHFLDHPCASCWSVDLTVTVHTGRCETSDRGAYCKGLL